MANKTVNALLVTYIMIINLTHYILCSKNQRVCKCYDGQSRWLYFLTEDDDLLKKYNTTWNKECKYIEKEKNSD